MRDYDDDYNYKKSSYSRSSQRDDEGGGDKANELFGGLITLPENITPIANFLKNTVKPYIVKKGEDIVEKGLPRPLMGVGLEEATAKKISGRAATLLAYAIIFSDQLFGGYKNVSNFIGGRRKLADDLTPVLKAEGAKDMLSGLLSDKLGQNEVVQVARKRLSHKWVQDTFTDMSDLAAALPTLYMHYADKKQEREKKTITGNEQSQETYAQRLTRLKAEYPDFDAEDVRTLLKEENERERTRLQSGQEDIRKTRDVLDRWAVPGGAAAAEFLRGHFVGKEKKAASKTTALEMILKLSETVINDKDATGVNGVPFDAYIRKIFDTHQENMGQSKIGKRFEEKIEFACKEIASAITKGKMHPMALVHLVGDREIVKEKGKKITPREEVKNAIARQVEKMPAKFAVDADEYIAESPVSEEKYKARLGELQGDAKEFYIAALPPEVARKIGSSDEEIAAAQKKFKHGEKANDLAKAVLDLGTLSDEQLKKAGQTEKEIALVRKLAPKAKEGRHDELMEAVTIKGEFKGALDTLVAGAMAGGLISCPGELYEKAGKKLFGEQDQKQENVGHKADEAAEEKDGLEATHENHEHDEESGFSNHEEAEEKPGHQINHSRHFGRKSASAAEHGFGAE